MNPSETSINLFEVFNGSPAIYTLLIFLSFFSFSIWLYSLFTLSLNKLLPEVFLYDLKQNLKNKDFESALKKCKNSSFLGAHIIAEGLALKNHGRQQILEAILSEGKRVGVSFWQRLSLLNDVVVIAPMVGLLGTVIGMFYAFYDVNRSIDSLTAIFDGLGIAVGTTVAGLIVALLSLVFHATLKYRIVRTLNLLEKESLSLIPFLE